ncbi:cofilin family protein [Streptomyces sp. NBC_01310]|uniref:hypothetical protein n=1 Tax=Streptomyces sp. NBC_01310 TaxID=2903820 RepID=UPI0035B68762|nr:cofilin family protein [Streptomyces sp. NBC_01310]
MKEQWEINSVILRYAGAQGVLVPEAEGNLTHAELVQSLPADEPRLIVHELAFASPEGTRRHTQLLITALREFLPDVHVHLTARRTDRLAYRRLVALAG